MKQNSKLKWFSYGTMAGLASLTFALASVPSRVTDDTALYQNLSEIRVAKAANPNFDSDIARLSALESRYREKLQSPMKRIATQKYRFIGAKSSQAKTARVVRQ